MRDLNPLESLAFKLVVMWWKKEWEKWGPIAPCEMSPYNSGVLNVIKPHNIIINCTLTFLSNLYQHFVHRQNPELFTEHCNKNRVVIEQIFNIQQTRVWGQNSDEDTLVRSCTIAFLMGGIKVEK